MSKSTESEISAENSFDNSAESSFDGSNYLSDDEIGSSQENEPHQPEIPMEIKPEMDEETRDLFIKIAQCSKQIIIEPRVHLMDILFIFDQYTIAPDLITLTLFKIFNEILPNYEPQKGNSKEEKYEKDLLMMYEKYLGILMSNSYDNKHLKQVKLTCCSNLLSKFQDFPHTQKLISHLLTNNFATTSVMESNNLKLIFDIITGFNNLPLGNISRTALESLFSINIHDFLLVQDGFMTGYFYEKEKMKNKKGVDSGKNTSSKGKHTVHMTHEDKKEEKARKFLENKRLEEEGKVSESETKKVELKICNGMLKLFLLIMKEAQAKNADVFHLLDLVFIGLRKFHFIVKDDLLAGIKIMILDIIRSHSNATIRFQGILAIITLFEKKSIDLKVIRDFALSAIREKIKNSPELCDGQMNEFFKLLVKALKSLLLNSKVPLDEVLLFLDELMLICSLTHSSILSNLLIEIREFYEIEDNFSHIQSVYRKMYYYNS